MVQVLTDSTSYISEKTKKELGIKIVSLNITFGDQTMPETDIDNIAFYEMMQEKGIPKSSQPAVGVLYEQMTQAVAEGDSLCCVFLSAEMSGTYAAGNMVKEMILKENKQAMIEIVDSGSNSMQLGFAAIMAARAAKAGKSLAEVKKAALDNTKRSRFLFIPDTLEYLRKGGRIGNASALLGNLFKIIPILTVEDGKTTTFMKVRTRKNAIAAMLDKMVADVQQYGLGEVVVHHINCKDKAQELAQLIERTLSVKPEIVSIGPVIGLHVGPGTVGFVYYTEKAMR
jgi:DegV family protein with EDD domain